MFAGSLGAEWDMDVSRRRVWLALAACAAGLMLLLPATGGAQTLPPGFDDQYLADVPLSTAMAFTPDGRLLLASQTGQLRVYENGSLKPTPALDLSNRLCSDNERGLLGVAVDPGFADQPYVYVYYTYKKNNACGTYAGNPATQPVNRVARFLMGPNDVIDPASEQVLIDNMPAPAGAHNAGDLQFGKDGYLYVAVGDGYCEYPTDAGCGPYNKAARSHNLLLGKILRITSGGGIPPDNPFTGPGTSRCNTNGQTDPGSWCQETYAWGLRNPWRLAFDPNAAGTVFYINDVGQNNREEIDRGQAGADYGWNVREGNCAVGSDVDCGPPPVGMTNPIYDYDHTAGCTSITAGAFVPDGAWPSQYDGSYLYGDVVCQKYFQLVPDGSGGWTAVEFASDVGGVISASFGPDGATQSLYYLAWGGEQGLHRIKYTGAANRSPDAHVQATNTNGAIPLQVGFDASTSSDPDGDTLEFDWDFGDGSLHASGAVASHIYAIPGTYTAKVTVSDQRGGEDTATTRIDAGNSAPTPQITSPAADQEFSVGETVTLSGSASDPDDGPLPDSALTWRVIKHHATHTHPFLPSTSGNGLTITAPVPEDMTNTENSYLEVFLTATDSKGLSTTISRDLRPNLVNLGFETNPQGLRLELNGTAPPRTITSWEGWNLNLNAPELQFDAGGKGATFVSWSDGGTANHTITTPATDTSYIASFTYNYARSRGATPVRVPLVPAYRPCTAPNRAHGPPLDFGSCTPPVPASSYLTVGTPDANGLPPRSVGFVRLKVVTGDPSTPQNEADVGLTTEISDVLDATRNNHDYVGQLLTSVGVRLTDRQNGSWGTDAATVSTFPLNFAVPCVVTPEPSGSNCYVQTSANALTPGMVVEHQRALWQLGQIQVFDGGADGTLSDDKTLFAVQGLFVP
jgi:glucose/arabinose dehydrogenase/PKD repeat protein